MKGSHVYNSQNFDHFPTPLWACFLADKCSKIKEDKGSCSWFYGMEEVDGSNPSRSTKFLKNGLPVSTTDMRHT
jgi:hypothetical protein